MPWAASITAPAWPAPTAWQCFSCQQICDSTMLHAWMSCCQDAPNVTQDDAVCDLQASSQAPGVLWLVPTLRSSNRILCSRCLGLLGDQVNQLRNEGQQPVARADAQEQQQLSDLRSVHPSLRSASAHAELPTWMPQLR